MQLVACIRGKDEGWRRVQTSRLPNPSCIPASHPLLLGTGHCLSPGRGWGGGGRAEDLGLNMVKFSRCSLWMLLHWSRNKVIPPNNIWWLSRPRPPGLHFPSKFEWSLLWILPKFSVIPTFGFSVTTDPPFCCPNWSTTTRRNFLCSLN